MARKIYFIICVHEISVDEIMGWLCGMHGRIKLHTRLWWVKLKKERHLECRSVGIIIKINTKILIFINKYVSSSHRAGMLGKERHNCTNF